MKIELNKHKTIKITEAQMTVLVCLNCLEADGGMNEPALFRYLPKSRDPQHPKRRYVRAYNELQDKGIIVPDSNIEMTKKGRKLMQYLFGWEPVVEDQVFQGTLLDARIVDVPEEQKRQDEREALDRAVFRNALHQVFGDNPRTRFDERIEEKHIDMLIRYYRHLQIDGSVPHRVLVNNLSTETTFRQLVNVVFLSNDYRDADAVFLTHKGRVMFDKVKESLAKVEQQLATE